MKSSITIKEAYGYLVEKLSTIYELPEAQSVAKILFEDAFKIYQPSGEKMDLKDLMKFSKYEARLMENEPVQYVLGQADFFGLKLHVNKDVLIPRQETEELVFNIRKNIKKRESQSEIRILDIGTGSGCIAIWLAKNIENAKVTAIDVSANALEIARKNAKQNKASVEFIELNFLDENAWSELGTFDIIVSNPPYVLQKEKTLMPRRVTNFEPHLALFVDDQDGLIFYKQISAFAKDHLSENGSIYLECNEFNGSEVLKHYNESGYKDAALEKDLMGKERLLIVS